MSAVEDRDLRDSDLDAPPLHARLTHARRSSPGIYGWLATVNHKAIVRRRTQQ